MIFKERASPNIPSSRGSEHFALACNDQGTGTMHMNQGHRARTRMMSSGGL